MNRLYENFKTPSDPSTGKALLNHTIFSPSQTGDTVPLKKNPACWCQPLSVKMLTVDRVGQKGMFGYGKGLSGTVEMGQLILSMGTAWNEVRILAQRGTTLS
jgi:hypothetical protein